MSVKVRSTGLKFDAIQLTTPAVMTKLGKMAIEDITTLTEAGKDVSGRAFAPYSESYAEWKADYHGGSMGAKVGTGSVDLRVSGRMLEDMQIVEASNRKVVIAFASARSAELAFYHVESGAGRSRVIRDFFGLTPMFLRRAVSRIKASWK